jgi:hypothetical protein
MIISQVNHGGVFVALIALHVARRRKSGAQAPFGVGLAE